MRRIRETTIERKSVEVCGVEASFLTAGLRAVAVDLPGCGRSGGELTLDTARVPALAAWVDPFVEAHGHDGPVRIAGHGIGGAVAQWMASRSRLEVSHLALVNSVSYDSWPVPGVARFRDPEVIAAMTTDDLVEMRRKATYPAHAMAGAADSRYTLDVLDDLRQSAVPKLLVWGEDEVFQPVAYAERLAGDLPHVELVRVEGAGHIPMENDPARVASALSSLLVGAGRRPGS